MIDNGFAKFDHFWKNGFDNLIKHHLKDTFLHKNKQTHKETKKQTNKYKQTNKQTKI